MHESKSDAEQLKNELANQWKQVAKFENKCKIAKRLRIGK